MEHKYLLAHQLAHLSAGELIQRLASSGKFTTVEADSLAVYFKGQTGRTLIVLFALAFLAVTTFNVYAEFLRFPFVVATYLVVCAVVTLIAVVSYGETRTRDLAADHAVVTKEAETV